jgi:hypothetical protein
VEFFTANEASSFELPAVNDEAHSDPLQRPATLLGLAAALAFSSVSASVAAAPSESLPIDLRWEGPASCPASDDIDRDVRRFLGGAILPEASPPIEARVSVRQSDDGRFDVLMLTTSGDETRERGLRTETCDEARELVAFLLALLIDPRAGQSSPAPAVSPPPPAKPPPAPPPKRAPPPRAPAGERDAHWVAALSASAELGVLPGGSVGGEARAGFVGAGWSVEGFARAWLPRHAESPDVEGAGGEFTAFEAGLFGCVRGAPWDGPALQGCAGPALVSLRGEGYGVTAPGSESALFAAAAAEVALLVAISRQLSLRAALGGLVPFRRPSFAIHDVGPIHRPSAVAARAALGLEVQF